MSPINILIVFSPVMGLHSSAYVKNELQHVKKLLLKL
jgi:hypothetical protein